MLPSQLKPFLTAHQDELDRLRKLEIHEYHMSFEDMTVQVSLYLN